ncbi:MAG TPA: PLD nuclease N-terminal domain-containing protein [Pseudolysinimonas sp.]|jgi:hypothetical protein
MTHLGSLASLATLPSWTLIALGAVLVAEIVLDVVALVDLYRRPIDRVALGNKWAWVAIIVLVNLLGPILYFIVGRRPAAANESSSAPVSAEQRGSIADALYGDRDGGSAQK